MLLLKFNYDDIQKCGSVEDVFRMFGIGVDDDDSYKFHLKDENIFGGKAYYRNMFISDETYHDIYTALRRSNGSKEVFSWCSYSPISSGPRFEQVKELVGGEINRSVLYILTPEDDLYEKSPIERKENV